MKHYLPLLMRWFLIAVLVVSVTSGGFSRATSPSESPPKAGSSVVFNDETLFVIKQSIGGLSPEKRASRIEKRLQEYADNYALSVDEIEVMPIDREGIPLTAVVVGDNPLITLSELDAREAEKTRAELANDYAGKIKAAIDQYRRERSTGYLIHGLIVTALTTLASIVGFFILKNLFARVYARLWAWGNTSIRPVRLGNFELIRANQLDDILRGVVWLIEATIWLGFSILYFPFILSQFPWTKGWATQFWRSLDRILQLGWQAFVGYLPNLLTIVLVISITYGLLRLCKPVFRELSTGAFSMPGFYPEWAFPTYRIATFLIIALAAVVVFPLLPGFNSPAFQGISVFLGILFSLGSTSIVANAVSGTILIYTRAFRLGDRVKVGDTFGQVVETTLLVTRLLTPTNVIISIPNSQIISSSIENFNFAAQELEQPLIVRTKVYLGYEVPWRKAYEALIQAALATDGVARSPLPFVLQDELNEVYVTYLLNVYLDAKYFTNKSAQELEQARSRLHENVRDCCQNAGIMIFAPSYEADPTSYGPVAEPENPLVSDSP